MNDNDIDEILDRAAPHKVDGAVLDRVTASIGASMRPVRPMAPLWRLALVLLLTSTAVALIGAWSFSMYGIQKLSVGEVGAIFPALAIFTWLAALVSVAAVTPGGSRWKNPMIMEPVMNNPAMLLLVVIVCFLALDAIFFHDYGMDYFARQGIPCLRAGLMIAAPTQLASWLMLRRGFAVNPTAAGLAAGTLAGLTGLTMLEIHCPNFHAMHVMVWHTAVIPVSALVGVLLWIGERSRFKT
jgi:hypothetical protein